MGGGDTAREETRRRLPANDAPGSGDGGGGPESSDFCALQNEIAFEGPTGQAVPTGQRVRLQAQHLPLVVAGGRTIGAVEEPHASAMRHCLVESYRMAGSVVAYDPATGKGTLKVTGTRADG